ncbi:DUF3363 domain-containing protein [Stenotrophomonas maltophilia]|uniref:DUF3363 domain-containing protein n=1 Tax=Stenotrophomonas maltophilia TaxID=40324 RepID=UPI003D2F84D0
MCIGPANWLAVDGQRLAGIYRRSVTLASGRYAMLRFGLECRRLVPWRPDGAAA